MKVAAGLGAVLLVLLAGAGVCALAQSEGQLSGVVRTGQGIPVPTATVRAENTTSHQAWMSWTDASGKFQFPALPPGQYRVQVSMLGFSPASGEVNVSSTGGMLDLTIHVATLAELSSTTGSARRTVNAAGRGVPAPRPGRKPTAREGRLPPSEARQQMAPGVENAMRSGMGGFQQVQVSGGEEEGEFGEAQGQGQSNAQQVPGQTSPQVSGALSTQPLGAAASSDAFLMNGSVGMAVNTLPGAGTGFGHFGPGGPGMRGGMPGGMRGGRGGFAGRGRIRGRGPGPMRGRRMAAGSVAGLWARRRFMRQSVNRVRFNIFETYNNSAWDALPYSLSGNPQPALSHYNERLGGSLGGPLFLPHIYDGRNRTFFFVNYNLEHQKNQTDTYATVPTVTERTGNFCDRNAQLYDPSSNLTGPRTSLGCSIPSNMQNSAAVGLLKYIPEPNLPGFVQNFQLLDTVPQTSNFINVHVFHTISSRFSLSTGYNFQTSHADTLTDFPLIGGNTQTRNQNVSLSLTQNWTPRLIDVTSLNFNRSRIESLSNNSYTQNVAADLGITGVSSSPIDYGIPQISFTNFAGFNDPIPALNRNQTWRFDDSLTYILKDHTLTAGFELRRVDWNKFGDPTPRGAFTFTGLMTSQLDAQGQPVAGTGLDFADFLLGLPQATTLRYGSAASYFRGWGYAAYVQDDWHIVPRFTLSYGLRYNYVTPPIELYNAIANLDVSPGFAQSALVLPGETGPYSGALPRSLVRGDPNNWAPRVGFAWQPFHTDPLIVRGGYSIFYNESIYQQLAFEMANQPPFAEVQTSLTSPTDVLTLQNGFPAEPQTANPNTYAVDPNYRVGYAQIWDLSIERQFRGGWMVDVYYTGTKGTHLDMQLAPHSEPPGSPLSTGTQTQNGFIYDTSGAASVYHAVHLMVRKRPTHGLMVMGDYSFGKSIDDASTIGGGTPIVVQNDNDIAAEYGLSSFDIRQQFRGFTFYQLPFGPRQRWARGGWTERLFGNFRLNAIITANTGTPFTARVLGASTNNTATGANFSLRADQVGSGCGGPDTTTQFFNTAAFVVPPAGQYGDAARNTICGPGVFSLNLGIDRSFVFGSDHQRHLDLRWETRNLTNSPQFTGLSTVVNSANYGRVTSVGSMRTMDLVVRLSF